MKQITISDILNAFDEEPISIGDRLKALGISDKELSFFSKELLETKVYASSFVKFIHDNKNKFANEILIPPGELPENWKDPYEPGEVSVLDRLNAIGFAKEEVQSIFDDDVLRLKVNPGEFENLLKAYEKKLFDHMNLLANQE